MGWGCFRSQFDSDLLARFLFIVHCCSFMPSAINKKVVSYFPKVSM